MSIEVLEMKMEIYDELTSAMEMLDNITETEVLLAELKYYDNPKVLEEAKETIFKNASKELDKLNKMFKETKDV